MRIHGYDEQMIGYGPEDDLFNCRISRINSLLFLPDRRLATYHLWHPRNEYEEHQFSRNMEHWLQEKIAIWGAPTGEIEAIVANRGRPEWGNFRE